MRNPDGTWQRDASGNFVRNPALVDPAAKVIADKYRTAIAPIANAVIGSISGNITRTANAAGESALGDVIADGMVEYTSTLGAPQFALMNPGGIRADLTYANSPGGEPPGDVTFGECFTVQPFNNLVVAKTITGAQLKEVLEQQWAGYLGQTTTKFLQVSAGFHYSYDTTFPLGSRVVSMTVNGVPVDPAANYRIATNDFLSNGGDGFTRLIPGTDVQFAPKFDVDSLVAYIGGNSPLPPGPMNRITRLA